MSTSVVGQTAAVVGLDVASDAEILASMLVLTWMFMPMYYHDRIRKIRRRKEFYRRMETEGTPE